MTADEQKQSRETPENLSADEWSGLYDLMLTAGAPKPYLNWAEKRWHEAIARGEAAALATEQRRLHEWRAAVGVAS